MQGRWFVVAYILVIAVLMVYICTVLPSRMEELRSPIDFQNYVIYYVQPGDTLWKIASDKFPDKLTEEMVAMIRRGNDNVNPRIFPGQGIKIPVLD